MQSVKRTLLPGVMAAGLMGGMPALANDESAKAPARPAAFAQCLACHTVEQGRNAFGPSLATVAGRKAASLPDYKYSKALTDSGLTWDAGTLDQWLSGPAKLVPGTRMPFGGIADPERRKQVIDYLMTLK
ncbi:c-type cytochrome [Sandaracinobacteroides sp. A072]|uniref:c-type cytochrome n=1 Tax=Sandaracinobacteroides sp. A072 TaxID=3461146 RepID=UPI004043425F